MNLEKKKKKTSGSQFICSPVFFFVCLFVFILLFEAI